MICQVLLEGATHASPIFTHRKFYVLYIGVTLTGLDFIMNYY